MSWDIYQSRSKIATRNGFGDGLLEVGRNNDKIHALSADLLGSLKMGGFKKAFPNRFHQVGIAEANMMGIAAGLATTGLIPYTGTFANFSTGRVYDQVRQSIAYSGKNVKMCASHAGLTLGEDGATHQILEDLGLMRMLPGMTVINTCDYTQTYKATLAIAEHDGPVYLRFGRPSWPNFMPQDEDFNIGSAHLLKEGGDITVIATGHLVWIALEATRELEKQGVNVELINVHTIKPLDEKTIINSAKKTGRVVTAEEHNMYGGLGGAVSETLIQKAPVRMKIIGTRDTFGESGKPMELLEKYGLDKEAIIQAVWDLE